MTNNLLASKRYTSDKVLSHPDCFYRICAARTPNCRKLCYLAERVKL